MDLPQPKRRYFVDALNSVTSSVSVSSDLDSLLGLASQKKKDMVWDQIDPFHHRSHWFNFISLSFLSVPSHRRTKKKGLAEVTSLRRSSSSVSSHLEPSPLCCPFWRNQKQRLRKWRIEACRGRQSRSLSVSLFLNKSVTTEAEERRSRISPDPFLSLSLDFCLPLHLSVEKWIPQALEP